MRVVGSCPLVCKDRRGVCFPSRFPSPGLLMSRIKNKELFDYQLSVVKIRVIHLV